MKNEKPNQYFIFVYAPNIENWCLFSYFQPKTENKYFFWPKTK